MKFSEALVAYKQSLPATVYVRPEAFLQMWTMNGKTQRVSNPHLIIGIKEEWQRLVGGQISIEDERIMIDTRQLKQVDPDTRQVNELDSNDVFTLDVQQLAVSRAIITLTASGLHDDFYPTLAIVMTERGQKFCFGQTVRICSNFSVFNSDYFFETTTISGNGKLTTEKAIDLFKTKVLPRTIPIFEEDMQSIETLKSKRIDRREFLSFIGDLHSKIEFANYQRNARNIKSLSADDKDLPINSRQLAKVAIEAKVPSHAEYAWDNDTTTIWNVINYGTEHLKADRGADMATLLDSHVKWSELVKNYDFKLS